MSRCSVATAATAVERCELGTCACSPAAAGAGDAAAASVSVPPPRAAGPHRPRHLRRGPVALRAVATQAYRASSDLLGKFSLGSNFELQPLVNQAPQDLVAGINLEVTNSTGYLIWKGGDVMELQCTRTGPFGRAFCKGGNSTLRIVIDDPALQAIECLFFDEAQNKWSKSNCQNFQTQLKMSRRQGQDAAGASSSSTMPEDLVQIQPYLQWERNGKQSYTPEQEKVPESSESESPASQSDVAKVPGDLIQVQACTRWEKVEFDEASKELKAE
ncbi:hypothetical protein ACP70R_034251 [Stipagrostis hirtigluma subsp. patula]